MNGGKRVNNLPTIAACYDGQLKETKMRIRLEDEGSYLDSRGRIQECIIVQ